MTTLLLERFTQSGLLDIEDADSQYAQVCLGDLLKQASTSDNDTALFLVEEIAELSNFSVQLDNKLAEVLTAKTSAHSTLTATVSPIQKVLAASELAKETATQWPLLAAKAASMQQIPTSIATANSNGNNGNKNTDGIRSSADLNSPVLASASTAQLSIQSLPALLALAELPQTTHMLVSSGSQSKGSNHLASAVEVAALGQRVFAMHSSSLLTASVSRSLQLETTALARYCCSLLQSGPNSSLLQTVTALQRLLSTSNNSSMLPALFLRLRHNNIADELDALSPLRDSGLTEVYGKRVLEVLREQGFHTVATFHSLFTANTTNTPTTNPTLLIHSFVQGLIQLVLPLLTGLAMQSLDSEISSFPQQLIPQLLYCAQSLARPGADYTTVLLQKLPDKPLIDAMNRQKTLQRSLNH